MLWSGTSSLVHGVRMSQSHRASLQAAAAVAAAAARTRRRGSGRHSRSDPGLARTSRHGFRASISTRLCCETRSYTQPVSSSVFYNNTMNRWVYFITNHCCVLDVVRYALVFPGVFLVFAPENRNVLRPSSRLRWIFALVNICAR